MGSSRVHPPIPTWPFDLISHRDQVLSAVIDHRSESTQIGHHCVGQGPQYALSHRVTRYEAVQPDTGPCGLF